MSSAKWWRQADLRHLTVDDTSARPRRSLVLRPHGSRRNSGCSWCAAEDSGCALALGPSRRSADRMRQLEAFLLRLIAVGIHNASWPTLHHFLRSARSSGAADAQGSARPAPWRAWLM